MPDPSRLDDAKAGLRRKALARRDALPEASRAAASRAIAERVLALPELARAACVAAYWPMRSEVDPRPILEGLHARGQATALPVTAVPHLIFRRWRPGDALARSTFGTSEPGAEAAEVHPDALLVPLAAFDPGLNRIGYGRGHYDRAITALAQRGPLLTIGLAFAAQHIARVPALPHDRPLERVATEEAWFTPVPLLKSSLPEVP